jgi:hypothetical protein
VPELLEGLPLPEGVDPGAVLDAAEAVRSYCDWHIAPSVTETLTLPVVNGVALIPSLHVTAVASVNGLATGYTWTTSGRVQIGSGYSHHYHSPPVTVVLTHGYETCPAVVRAAVLQIAARGLVSAEPQLRSKADGPFQRSFYSLTDPFDSVSAYRRIGVA